MSTHVNPPCPHLPIITEPLTITHAKAHRANCGEEYFYACHELAQSLWQNGTPAQAILQIDKSFMASQYNNIGKSYLSILWMVKHSPEGQFIGNPVRHFQHLATRMNMSQPNAELRIWRAWACLHLIEKIHTQNNSYPRDKVQIEKEQLTIPTMENTLSKITELADIQESVFLENLFLSQIN